MSEQRRKIVILNAPTPTKNSPYIYNLKYINLEYDGVADYRALFSHFLMILRTSLHAPIAYIHCDSRYYLYEIFMPYVFKMSIAIH